MPVKWYDRTWSTCMYLFIIRSFETSRFCARQTVGWNHVNETLPTSLAITQQRLCSNVSLIGPVACACTQCDKRHAQPAMVVAKTQCANTVYCKRMIDVEDEFIYTVWIHFIFALFFCVSVYRWISSTSAVTHNRAIVPQRRLLPLLHVQFNLIVSVYYY